MDLVYDPRLLPGSASHFQNVPLAAGCFDAVGPAHDPAHVCGWMLLPDRAFPRLQVYLNWERYCTAEPMPREDLPKAYPFLPHAFQAGFQFRLPQSVVQRQTLGRIDVLGFEGDCPIARLSTLFRPGLDAALPERPHALRARTQQNPESPHWYNAHGLKNFGDFLEALGRHGELGKVQRMLDWGCGSGRVTAHWVALRPGPEVHGCDIDGDAVAWCNEQLRPGVFRRIEPWPPTPYEDGMFDLVISCSVFTHLTREAQNAWLEEIRRILKPDGLFLATVQGDFAASFAFPAEATKHLRKGFYHTDDPALDGVAPQGYYRSTFQTRRYTLWEWSRYFAVLDYVERGVGNYQDLVVMQRSTKPTVAPLRRAATDFFTRVARFARRRQAVRP
jgi:SAM-dependent methyltransferase